MSVHPSIHPSALPLSPAEIADDLLDHPVAGAIPPRTDDQANDVEDAPAPSAAVPVSRQARVALFALGGGALLGLAGMLVFFRVGLGLNVLLFFTLCTAALFIGARSTATPARRPNLLLIAPVLVFSLALALWESNEVRAWNWAAIFGFGGLALAYFAHTCLFTRDGLGQYALNTLEAGVVSLGMPLVALSHATGAVKTGSAEGGAWRSQQLKRVLAAGRGLLIAAPILLVFTVLLASADAVFSDFLRRFDNLFDWRTLDDLAQRVLFAGALGWFAAGGLAYALHMPTLLTQRTRADHAVDESLKDAKAKPKRHPWLMVGHIEAITVLSLVVGLFAVFVVIQFTYFFGGQINLADMTYSQYARRGFFELVAVSVLTLGLLLWLDSSAVRPNPRALLVFRLLASALVALTGVLLVSAAGRMTLYEQAYGYTHLRIGTQVFMAWLGVLFGIFVIALYLPRGTARWFAPALLGVGAGYLLTLNVINMDAIIARENLARFEAALTANPAATEDEIILDFVYLNTLSADAAGEIFAFWQRTQDTPNTRLQSAHADAAMWLANTAQDMRATDMTLLNLNVSRARAWSLTEPVLDDLPAADPRYQPLNRPTYASYLREQYD